MATHNLYALYNNTSHQMKYSVRNAKENLKQYNIDSVLMSLVALFTLKY